MILARFIKNFINIDFEFKAANLDVKISRKVSFFRQLSLLYRIWVWYLTYVRLLLLILIAEKKIYG